MNAQASCEEQAVIKIFKMKIYMYGYDGIQIRNLSHCKLVPNTTLPDVDDTCFEVFIKSRHINNLNVGQYETDHTG